MTNLGAEMTWIQTGHNEQYFTCQTKLQQTMLWACVR
jgi:hypothetical protein